MMDQIHSMISSAQTPSAQDGVIGVRDILASFLDSGRKSVIRTLLVSLMLSLNLVLSKEVTSLFES